LPARFPVTNAPSSDTKAGDPGASILQDGQSVCRRPTVLEPDRPRAATECSLCAPTTADDSRPRAVYNRRDCARFGLLIVRRSVADGAGWPFRGGVMGGRYRCGGRRLRRWP
jgi:hypothetical protein